MKSIVKIGLFATVLFFSNCKHNNESESEKESIFTATKPLKKDTSVTREYVCQIRAFQHIELRAYGQGYLDNIYVDEGQLVKKGQSMFQIMPLLYKAELQKAQAEANFIEIEYQNTKQLFDKNVVSQNELSLAKAKLDKANAEVELARVHLQLTDVKAPFDGIMDRFQVRQGSLVSEGDLLTTLSDNTQMWIYFNVPEAEYLNYKAHITEENLLKVNLLLANNQLFQYPGEVKTIIADFNNETGNIPFRATFPNPDGLLRHGQTGNIEMSVPVKNALIIPQKATYEVLEKKFVFVVDNNNVVHAREIHVASELPDLYIIKSGLTENDKILLEGIRKVNDGEKIETKFETPENVLKNLSVYVE